MVVAVVKLAAEKFPVICIIEFLNHTITPGCPKGDKNRLNTKVQTQTYDQTRRSGVPVAAAKNSIHCQGAENSLAQRLSSIEASCRQPAHLRVIDVLNLIKLGIKNTFAVVAQNRMYKKHPRSCWPVRLFRYATIEQFDNVDVFLDCWI